MSKTWQESTVVYGTEDILTSLCNSVTRVLSVATQSQIHYSGMVQRISKTCLKPDIGCFVLFDGGFSGLVVLNFSAATAMELYENYMINMGMPKSELASAHTSDEVSNIMGELMNQIVGDFTSKVARELGYDFGEIAKGLTLDIRYDAEWRAFPSGGLVVGGRRDIRATLRAEMGLSDTQFYGFTPVVSVEGTQNRSNVALYDSKALRMGFSLRSDF